MKHNLSLAQPYSKIKDLTPTASKISNLIRDFPILKQARADAFEIVSKDPLLTQNTHQKIRQKVLETFKDRLELISIG